MQICQRRIHLSHFNCSDGHSPDVTLPDKGKVSEKERKERKKRRKKRKEKV